jgi:hypothetical protein
MNEFRKSLNPYQGVTIKNAAPRNEEKKIIDSMNNKPVDFKHFGNIENDPTFSMEKFNPERALEDLEKRNHNNRKIKDQVVRQYSYLMKTNQWKMTAETIKYDRDNNLLDGQHRLAAIVESGVTLWLPVARNVDPEVRSSIDSGCRRSMGDSFRMFLGVTNGMRMVAAIKMFYMLNTGKQPQLLSYDDCRDIYENNMECFSWMEKSFSGNTMFDNAVIAGSLALAYKSDNYRITQFAEQLHTGLNLEKGSPILALRDAIINVKTSRKSRNTFGDLVGRYKFALKVLRAASLYLDDKTIVGSSNLYATPLGLRYFMPTAPVPSFMFNDDQNS